MPKDALAAAASAVEDLTRPPGDRHFDDLLSRYPAVRRFLPALLDQVAFGGNEAARPVLEALAFLRRAEHERPRPSFGEAPLAVVTPAWRRLVVDPSGGVDRRAYAFCVLERLRDGLRRRDVFVEGSRRWRDPHAQLLSGPAWEAARAPVCRTLGRQPDPGPELADLAHELDGAYRRTAANLAANPAVSVEHSGGKDTLKLAPLDRLDEPASLTELRAAVAARLPRIDLPEVLLDVAAWTGFAAEFAHVSEAGARVDDLATSVCAVLLAQACNVGLEPLARPDVPALTRARLAWVAQNYVRTETLVAANARLVDHHATLPLARAWGGGEVASADGLRFVVPVRTVNAGPNPRYFGVGRGVTYYNFVSDQFSGFHAIVVPGTLSVAMRKSPLVARQKSPLVAT